MSLRTRIAVLVGLTVLLASIIGGIGTAVSSLTVGRDRIDEALLGDADDFLTPNGRLGPQVQFAFDARQATCDSNEALGDELGLTADDEDAEAPPTPRRSQRLRFLPDFSSNMQLLTTAGRSIPTCQALPVDEVDLAIAESGTGERFTSISIDGERFRLLTRGFGEAGAIQFARSLEITNDTLRGLLVRSLGFGLLGAALASTLGWLLASRATEPVRQLSETAERVAATQDLSERIDVSGPAELGALAGSFNTMLSSLATSQDQQKRLVQDASHELRTPLTSIRTNVDLLQRHTDIDPTIRQEIIADIESELTELTELTTEVVDSASHVPTTIEMSETLRLSDVAERCAERAERRHRRSVAVHVTEPAPAVIGDSSLLARAVTNLINNAVKFSDGDIEVWVQDTSVIVRDSGPGIPEDDIDHIFDRFYRATTSRSAPGSGLGLAIVKQVVEAHGGTVHARNRAEGGAEVGFQLPGRPTT